MFWAIVALSLLPACSPRRPEGQVVAVVDGRDITVQDVLAEWRASGRASMPDRRALTQSIVSRVLLAEQARVERLDKEPEFPADRQRLLDDLLASKLLHTLPVMRTAPRVVSDAEATAYMKAHPLLFAQRTLYRVDEIVINDAQAAPWLETVPSLSRAETILHTHGTPYKREVAVLDTATIPTDLALRMAKAAPDEVIAFHAGGILVELSVLAHEAQASPLSDQLGLARRLILQSERSDAVNRELGGLRAKAKIQYQTGYEPLPQSP